jgi:hypothetical protein
MALTIYVSSTFEDLKVYRERVYHQLRSLRHDVIAMEDYVAADNRPLDKCLKDVRESDVYVGLFAWRYGFVPKKENPKQKSITELEYLEATKHHKPRFVFVLNERAAWPLNQTDMESGENGKGAKIKAFRQSLRDEHMAGMFETPEELAAKVISALFQWQTESSQAAAGSSGNSAVAYSGARQPAAARKDSPLLWVPGSMLRVRFLAGDVTLRARVIRLAQIWGAYANIGFALSEDADAEIRVQFDENLGSWSYEGARCLNVSKTEPTMNFGWLRADSPIEEIESTVLHEFGHVLGLAHEHANPAGALPWDRKKVYASLTGAPNHWTKEVVDANVLATWPRDRFPFAKPFDPLSIMAWSFPAEFTGGEEIFRRNVAISAGDKEFVSRLYPYPATGGAARPASAVTPKTTRSVGKKPRSKR